MLCDSCSMESYLPHFLMAQATQTTAPAQTVDESKQKFEPEFHEETFADQAEFDAWLKKKAAYRMHFEDHHQDFLVWTLDEGGEVIHCEPFQASIWCGTIVNLMTLMKGERPDVQLKSRPGKLTTMNYAVTKIDFLKAEGRS